jgi:uncharacterized membrane protein
MTAFLTLVGIHFGFFICCDGLYLLINSQCGFIYPKQTKKTYTYVNYDMAYFLHLGFVLFNCLLCWFVSALYIAGHFQDTIEKAAYEGAWLGALVYSVFNATTIVLNDDWKIFTAIIDTLWGTTLFTIVSIFSFLIVN